MIFDNDAKCSVFFDSIVIKQIIISSGNDYEWTNWAKNTAMYLPIAVRHSVTWKVFKISA